MGVKEVLKTINPSPQTSEESEEEKEVLKPKNSCPLTSEDNNGEKRSVEKNRSLSSDLRGK